MASWDTDAELTHPLDFRLVQNSFVSAYWRAPLLDEAVDRLRSEGYDVVAFDARSWGSVDEMYDDVAAGLDFPDHFGRNLDALNDCLGDVASGAYGWAPDRTGLVLVLRGFDRFARREPRTAQVVLDILECRARTAILFGHRLIGLVQSDDRDLSFDPVGATQVPWNDPPPQRRPDPA